jgi:hypothetical protein
MGRAWPCHIKMDVPGFFAPLKSHSAWKKAPSKQRNYLGFAGCQEIT